MNFYEIFGAVIMAGIIFVAYPALVLIPIAIFVVAFYKLRSKLFLFIALVWALYPVYELQTSRACPIEVCNIRADLIFIYLILYILTAIGIFSIAFKVIRLRQHNN